MLYYTNNAEKQRVPWRIFNPQGRCSMLNAVVDPTTGFYSKQRSWRVALLIG